ncbi:hypothetical protein PRUB_a3417 [Pseudoalteromonas rubra]|uniref:Uncharacterized protein n=1 Tax=Pseudoalteromonas rubra TaxID=43658 RepID=A0A8T0C3I6_9GAMM|nr:hypothetical protein PRUB_a3417 [Pseudoalteromonas rubra]
MHVVNKSGADLQITKDTKWVNASEEIKLEIKGVFDEQHT